MEQARLEVQLREASGKGGARATRRAGFVPAILYGHKIDPISIKLPERTFRRFLSEGGENVIINLALDGNEAETVVLKEVQVDPVSRRVMHADFVRVSLEEVITTHVPIVLIGEPPALEEGGIQEFPLRELEIECQVGKMPENIEVDVSSLNIGDRISVGDIEVGEDMTILDDPATVIITIAAPSIIEEVAEEEEEGLLEEELMEPEVIGEKREEDEETEEEE
jgi:large subunit ribosomal protein L25